MLKNKLIINAALTGMVPTKGLTPHVPIMPEEIAQDAKRVCELGASIFHIHAREDSGDSTTSKERYAEIISRIRDACGDVIITVSTSGRKVKDMAQRAEALTLNGNVRPDMASLTLGSMNFMEEFTVNSMEMITYLLDAMKDAGIRPELEIFGSGMANYAKYLLRKELLPPNCYANIIMGSLGTVPASPRHLVNLVEDLPESFTWAATGVGRFAFEVQCLSIAMGGHVRVGVEDSIYMDPEKTELATNEKLVRRVRDVALAMGREVATPGEVRAALGL
jgi:uncharacterized protein (DUF849 family)